MTSPRKDSQWRSVLRWALDVSVQSQGPVGCDVMFLGTNEGLVTQETSLKDS